MERRITASLTGDRWESKIRPDMKILVGAPAWPWASARPPPAQGPDKGKRSSNATR